MGANIKKLKLKSYFCTQLFLNKGYDIKRNKK